MHEPIQRLLIIGAGWTGRQIAAQSCLHGIDVTLIDSNRDVCIDAGAWITEHMARFRTTIPIPSEVFPEQAHHEVDICLRSDLDDRSFDLVLECVPESPSMKRRVLGEYSRRYPTPTIVASNSSYFTPSMLTKYVESPERFAHLHFHAPIWIATIVDVVPGPQATPDVSERLCAFAKRIGQTPIVQTVENPGYIFNSILQSMLVSALKLVDRKVAVPSDIELVWKTVTGMRVGPFGMMDWIGIDMIQHALNNARWLGDYDETQRLVDYLQPWIDRGDLGVKTGQGFFAYTPEERKQP